MLKKSHVLAAGLIVVLLSAAVSYAVSASVPAALLAAGTTRYAVVSATDTTTTTSGDFVNVPGLSTSISVPSGKKADVMIIFCGVVWSGSNMAVQAVIGSGVAAPGAVVISPYTGFDVTNFGQSRCFNFQKAGVGAGTKTVKIQWKDYDNAAATQKIANRSMIVTVNIH